MTVEGAVRVFPNRGRIMRAIQAGFSVMVFLLTAVASGSASSRVAVGSANSGTHSLSPECSYPSAGELRFQQIAKIAGDGLRLQWEPLITSAFHADAVRGSIARLSTSRGDFTIATERCLVEDSSESTFDDLDVPPAGDGYWYVLRVDRYTGCPLTDWGYNACSTRQSGDRDSEIRASGRSCVCFYEAQGADSCGCPWQGCPGSVCF